MTVSVEQRRRSMAKIADFINGKIGLSRSFWLFGTLVWPFFTLFCLFFALLVFHYPSNFTILLSILPFLACFLFTLVVSLAIWRSSSVYNGKEVWSVLAKAYSVAMYSLIFFPLAGQLVPLSLNQKTSATIRNLRPTPQMPYVGFWKEKSWHNFGIAIAPVGEGTYSVSFCGPGGCFNPGEWTPNTPIVGDPRYQVIDKDTIVFNATTWKRY